MNSEDRRVLLRDHPERYATTGLDWGNPAHHEAIANGLFQTLMATLARRQGQYITAEDKALRNQQARIEQRLLVAERLAYRSGSGRPWRMGDAEIVLGLERMADAFEEGARSWRIARATKGNAVLAGTMLGIGVGFAAGVRASGALERFSIGPFAALSKIGGLVTRPDVAVEMADLPALESLVHKAREIPVGHVVVHASQSCKVFYEAFNELKEKAQARDQAWRDYV